MKTLTVLSSLRFAVISSLRFAFGPGLAVPTMLEICEEAPAAYNLPV